MSKGIGFPLPRIQLDIAWADESEWDNARKAHPVANGWREYDVTFTKTTKAFGSTRVRIYYRFVL